MTRGLLTAACVLATSFVAGARGPASQTPAARSSEDRGILAVVRRDGLIVPFAAYHGAKWSKPWPVSTREQQLPITIEDVPEDWWGGATPANWQVYLAGGQSRPVTVTLPKVYRSFCDTRLGLVTDYRSAEPLPMPPIDPYPKDGLAMSPGLTLEPIESVDRAAPETAALARALRPDFNKAEEKALSLIHDRDRWEHPLKRELRHATPATIEAWYRAPMDEPGWTASYIEAVRSYSAGARADDSQCGLETVFTGWLHQNIADPTKTRMQLVARITYCDRLGVRYMLPFGRFHVGAQQYWVYQLSSFEEEWYEVARMTPLKMAFVIEAYGGGRQGCRMPRP